MSLNRGSCKTPILTLRSLMLPHATSSYALALGSHLGILLTPHSLGLHWERSPSIFDCIILHFSLLTNQNTKNMSSNLCLADEVITGQGIKGIHWAIDGGHSWDLDPTIIHKSSYELWCHFEAKSQVVEAWISSEHFPINWRPRKSTTKSTVDLEVGSD